MSGKTIQLHNLPLQPTPFIGREPEITEIVYILRDNHCRLLTLVGAGGMGKTRLAIECVKCLTPTDFEHGIYYVPLAPLTSAENVVSTVIGVLGIMIGDQSTPQQELVKFLSKRNLLLVMDNFEHVLDSVDLVADILNYAPYVKILVTSRETLNLQMERLWHVRGMLFPDSSDLNNIEEFSALKLFIERAKWIRRDFSVAIQLDCVIRICQLVGGMPLGIELAASWLKTLSCRGIIKQIEQGLDFLSTRARDIPQRHQSIHAVFDHSWNLLTPAEKAVFPRLSVFRGGFTLEAAEATADADITTLSGLVEKSMVRRDSTGRYDIHELLRQYADEKLTAIDEVEQTFSAHIAYFANFMVEHTIDIKGRRQLEGFNEISIDFENIRTAWLHAIDAQDYESLDRMVEALVLYCDMRSHYHEALDLLTQAISLPSDETMPEFHRIHNRLKVRWVQAVFLPESSEGLDPYEDQLRQSLDLAKQVNDTHTIGLCLWLLGELERNKKGGFTAPHPFFIDALTNYETALAFQEHWQDKYYEGRTLRGYVRNLIKSMTLTHEARTQNKKHLQVTKEIGDIHGLAHAIIYESQMETDYRVRMQRVHEAMTISHTMGDRKSFGQNINFLAILNCFIGDWDDAEPQAVASIQILETVGYHPNKFCGIIGIFALFRGDHEQALHYLIPPIDEYSISRAGAVHEALRDSLQLSMLALCQPSKREKRIMAALQYVNDSDFEIDKVACIVISTFILLEENEFHRVVQLLGLSFSYADHLLMGWMTKWESLTQMQQQLKSTLGDETYDRLWEQGTQLDLRQTIDELITYFTDTDVVETSKLNIVDALTPREQEVLELLALYECERKIVADMLHIGKGTVRTHISHIYGKLDVKNCSQAVLKARRLGLI